MTKKQEKPKTNQYQIRYKNGYAAYVEHSSKKGWTDSNTIPTLDAHGCSDLLIFHINYRQNPVGMDTLEHIEPGFFHAQAGKYGAYYALLSHGNGPVSRMIYMPDGWKHCDRPERDWLERFQTAKDHIERGDWNF